MARRIHVALFAAFLTPAVMADSLPEQWVAETLQMTDAPALAMGVAQGETRQITAAGVRAVGTDAAVTNDDLWHIGSITKSMTATLVARLAETDVVQWNDTVGDVLGDAIPDINPAFADLTYADLLMHRSGLQANLSRVRSLTMTGTLQDRDMMADRLAYAAFVLANEPAEPTGKFLYSNAGYVVVGAMLQQATGQTWEALIAEQVFTPLGLTSAGFGSPGSADIIDQPRGHGGLLWMRAKVPGAGADNIPVLGPAGTVHIGVSDMLTYLQAQATRDTDFLSIDSWMRLQSAPEGADYALGWRITGDGHYVHNGSNTLWYATAGFDPGSGRVAFAASNVAGGANDVIQQAVHKALSD